MFRVAIFGLFILTAVMAQPNNSIFLLDVFSKLIDGAPIPDEKVYLCMFFIFICAYEIMIIYSLLV